MDFLLTFAGLTGLSTLVQTKPLPSEAEALKALEKLEKTPDDPEANLICGKYKAFVLGHYKEGMEFLAKSSDKTLKMLAEHELDPRYTATAPQRVTMGDEWVLAARKFPALYRIFYDRAGKWYIEAFNELADPNKEKLREQAQKLSAARPPGTTKKKLPSGWISDQATPVLDGTIAHTGSYSVKLPSIDPKTPNAETNLKSDKIQATGDKLEFSAFVRSDGTDKLNDQLFVVYYDKDGSVVHADGPKIKKDVPFWHHVSAKHDIPVDAVTFRVGFVVHSQKGAVWVDDFSVKMDGKEVLKNPSFEER